MRETRIVTVTVTVPVTCRKCGRSLYVRCAKCQRAATVRKIKIQRNIPRGGTF